MVTVKELEKAVTDLPLDKLAEFRAWFESFDAARWDRQFEEDVKSGKLDRVAEKSIKDYSKGKAKPL
jgi:hypothetical protein